VSTDSRTLKPGDLFVALRGENFDGHNFVEAAGQTGAAGAIVESAWNGKVPKNFALVRTNDTLQAYQELAANYRKSLKLNVVAITGSNGKTSTKDFTAAVLARRFRVTKTEGNFNNHVGLPRTILEATSRDEIGVWEIGMNHPGEIAALAKLAAPDVAIITNIGVAPLAKARLQIKQIGGVEFIDDSYNANPDSMKAALRTLAELPADGKRIAVLGEMRELGDELERGHREVGETAATLKIDQLIAIGDVAAAIADAAKHAGLEKTAIVASTSEAAELLSEIAAPGDLVLVKGSRLARTERVIEAFRRPQAAAANSP